MRHYMKWFAAIAVVGALAGCARTAPIDQVHSTVSAGHTGNKWKSDSESWRWTQMDYVEAGQGIIKARQQSRDHSAEIRINYTASSYDINYENSQNLQASGGQIHKNYNRWVRNLDKDIQLNLSAGADL